MAKRLKLQTKARRRHKDSRYTQGCICGRLSLRSGVFAVALIELFFAAVSLVTAADYLIKDGHFFYSDAFIGYGKQLFGYSVTMNGLCIGTVLVLLAGVRTRQHRLLLPHVAWQAAYLGAQTLAAAAVLALWHRQQIFVQSAVVLLCEKAVCVGAELYFISVTYHCAIAIRMRQQVHETVASDGCHWARHEHAGALVQSRRHAIAYGRRQWAALAHCDGDDDDGDEHEASVQPADRCHSEHELADGASGEHSVHTDGAQAHRRHKTVGISASVL